MASPHLLPLTPQIVAKTDWKPGMEWPRVATPQSRDYRKGSISRWNDPRRSRNLNDQMDGRLNPRWVEWLMGWPLGWSSADRLEDSGHMTWDIEPDVPRTVSQKMINRVARIKALGNGQVPQCMAGAYRILTGDLK
jgi:hypothetical protein